MSILSQKVFLLGGYDLEMLTIKKMLEDREGCVVIDRHLRWHDAKLSAYQQALQQHSDAEIYGIELQEDITPPRYYHRIDHHNDLDSMPSAVEQVAEVLGVTLNREQLLVAANDKGYIPAMHALQATDDEITDIRSKDRAAQGVTEEEEKMAEKSISENMERNGSLTVVRSLTSRFSPICDRLFPYTRLLIYTDREWMYYGEGKCSLVQHFYHEITQKKVFYGGGEKGYIGCVKHAYSKVEIEQIVEYIIKEYGNI